MKNEYAKRWVLENKTHLKKYRSEYYKIHKKELKEKQKIYNTKNIEKRKVHYKDFREKNKEKIKEQKKEYYLKNKNKPEFILSIKISSYIRECLNGTKNKIHWENLVGYTTNDLIKHLEKTSPYLIEDYLNGELHIDHIIPKSLYKYISYEDEEFKKCWNLRNLRLITIEENLNKSNKLDRELIKKYNIEDLLPKKK